MQPKLLTTEDYFAYFSFQEYGTGCNVEQEPESGENYFCAETFLPKSYFDLDHPSLLFNPFIRHQLDDIPDKIQIKFELFGIGSLDNVEAFIFKPWVINIDNPMLYQVLESFHLFVPNTLFYNLIERLIFLEQINPSNFKYIRILQDIPSNTFQKFGIDRVNIPKVIKSDKLEITRIDEINKNEILNFYSDNWEGITPELENKYFRPNQNTWFRVTSEEIDNQWFGLKQSTVKKTIGFLRIYNKNSSFTGGTSLEYIIDKSNRNKGYASQASLSLINYLKKHSYAISIGAEVNDNNAFSKKVLKKLGFSESKSGPFIDDNFNLSLLNNLKDLEKKFDSQVIEVSVLNKYANKYSRYF